MTAITDREKLRDADDFREDFERLWESVRNGDASEEWAATCMRDHRPDLPPWDRWAIWEQLDDAFSRLAKIRGDMFDPADGDRDYLEHEADRDAVNAIAKIRGIS
jgi:hypothetical protein